MHSPEPLERLRQRWQAELPPPTLADLADLVLEHRLHSPAQLVDFLRLDQQERWRRGQGLPAEQYLTAFPALASSLEDALVLVCGEYDLLGKSARIAAFQSRFPDWADRLQLQLAFHDALGTSGWQGSATTSLLDKPPARSDAQPAIPQIPGYEILGELGRGGMGVVYRARQVNLNREVALKVLHLRSPSPVVLTRFRFEAEAVARLQHPWIVQVHDHGSHAGQPYLVLELVRGGNLAQLLERGPLAPARAARLVQQLAEAVHHAHQRGILHRDLKPSNVLLSEENRPPMDPEATAFLRTSRTVSRSPVPAPERAPEAQSANSSFLPKITDFGLAKRQGSESEGSGWGSSVGGSGQDSSDRLTIEGDVLGTPAYMAPEQVDGTLDGVTAATDIYALGAILYECLTGRPPFVGKNVLHTLELVRAGRPVPPGQLRAHLSRRLQSITLKCLARAPSRRFSSAAALAQELKTWQTARRLCWARAAPLVESLRTVPLVEVPRLLEQITQVRAPARPFLVELVEQSRPGSGIRLWARLALLAGDPNQLRPTIDDLLAHLPETDPDELPVLRLALKGADAEIISALWQALADPGLSDGTRLRAAGLLAGLQPDDPRWREWAPLLAEQLLCENPLSLGRWRTELRPVRVYLAPALAERFLNEVRAGHEHLVMTHLLADLAADNVPLLIRLLGAVDPPAFEILLARLSEHGTEAAAALEAYLIEIGRAGGSSPAPGQ